MSALSSLPQFCDIGCEHPHCKQPSNTLPPLTTTNFTTIATTVVKAALGTATTMTTTTTTASNGENSPGALTSISNTSVRSTVDSIPVCPNVDGIFTYRIYLPGHLRIHPTGNYPFRPAQINPKNWDDLARNRPSWRRTVKTGVTIYKANRIAAAKAKRVTRKSQASLINSENVQPRPTCRHCQRNFSARIGPVGHRRTQGNNNPTT
ncbi:unnamed protein product [Schistocephalus solidus]|uniref:C2H2-type domain-containing protein n=1 Tax=Schistocephalus solidus TaxID=70667 RepID=A0A183SDE8_SCHSO|nr:unnamed protein product [Schistocephalus solidus]